MFLWKDRKKCLFLFSAWREALCRICVEAEIWRCVKVMGRVARRFGYKSIFRA